MILARELTFVRKSFAFWIYWSEVELLQSHPETTGKTIIATNNTAWRSFPSKYECIILFFIIEPLASLYLPTCNCLNVLRIVQTNMRILFGQSKALKFCKPALSYGEFANTWKQPTASVSAMSWPHRHREILSRSQALFEFLPGPALSPDLPSPNANMVTHSVYFRHEGCRFL